MIYLERNSKIISWIIAFIFFEVLLAGIFDKVIELAGINQNLISILLALLASTAIYKIFEEKFIQAVKISYLFYALDRHIRCIRIS